MRNFRSLVLGLVLVILYPLGWGEEHFWQCSTEISENVIAAIDGKPESFRQQGTGDLLLRKGGKASFSLKWDVNAEQLHLIGDKWCTQCPLTLTCDDCSKGMSDEQNQIALPLTLDATNIIGRFVLAGKNYFFASVTPSRGTLEAGTCTKF